MKKYICLFFLALLFLSIQFSFDLNVGDIIQISSGGKEYIYIDDVLTREWDFDYIAKLSVTAKSEDGFSIQGKYDYFEVNNGIRKPLDSQNVEFSLSRQGRMYFTDNYLYPTLRSVPFFPNKNLEIGDQWWAQAEEMLDASYTGQKGLHFLIPINVMYEYAGNENNLAVIKAKYAFAYDFPLQEMVKYEDSSLPKLYSGEVEIVLYWNKSKNLVEKTIQNFSLYIVTIAGQKFKFTGIVKGYANIVRKMSESRKKELASTLLESIPPQIRDKIQVTATEKGIILNLGEVFFDFDKHALRESEKSKLQVIGDILKKMFYGYQIIVEGYTDNLGTEEYNQTLSEMRAKAIYDYLVSNKSIDPNLAYFIGYGETKPFYPNTTPQNRALNRRVQIVITDY